MATQTTFDRSTLDGAGFQSFEGFGGLDGFDCFDCFDDTLAGRKQLPFDPLDEELSVSADWNQQSLLEDPNYPPETKIEYTPPVTYVPMNTLTPAQQEKLRSIAMPRRPQYSSEPSTNSSTRESNSASSPDSNGNRKRKSSADADDGEDDDSTGQHPVKKTAHNMIEKRYRTNLNDKIAALRDSVPSLRIMTKSARGEDTTDDRQELQGLTPAHKLNKATVLSKATEYINHLEKCNKRLQDENSYMKSRIDAFEKLFISGAMGVNPTPQYSQGFQYSPDYDAGGPSPGSEPQGIIQVPEDIRRLHRQASQQIIPTPPERYQQNHQQIGPNGGQTGGGYFGKLMVGSLACLMVMEGFNQAEQETDSPNTRGLFAFPTHLLTATSKFLHASLDVNILGYHVSASQTLHYMKILFVLGALIYLYLPSLFETTLKPTGNKTQNLSLAAPPSVASSIQVRRQAWLTAIQTVWVPRHNFFLEAAALCLKIVKLSMRNVIGPDGYAYLTGISPQQEAARVKAWEIALDAQLAGGDIEVSKSRLTLTLLASYTLPDTPARLMLKALHIRVLLWEVGNAGFSGFYMFQEITAKLARCKWNEAMQLQRLRAHTKGQEGDELPDHLATLLQQECDDVLVDSIAQLAYNLAWNLPTTYNLPGCSDSMDCVVDDCAIRSPLDAVAAQWSRLVLQRALAKSLEFPNIDAAAQNSILEDITLAIKTAPIGSGAQIRALVAAAVLNDERRGANIAAALHALGPAEPQGSEGELAPALINTSTSLASLPDIKLSLRCAMAIAHLERFPPPANPVAARRIINSIVPANLTTLGFTASFKLMEMISGHESVASTCSKALERLAGSLRIWIGGTAGQKSGFEMEARKELVDRCLAITKKVIGMEKDAGYESMSEEDVAGVS